METWRVASAGWGRCRRLTAGVCPVVSDLDGAAVREQDGFVAVAGWLKAFADPPVLALDRQCVTCTPPVADPDVIAFSEYWKVVLHPDQTVPGACLIGSLRHVARVGELSRDEATDFFALYSVVEAALESVLGADLVNVWCLRNWAFRRTDPDPPFLDGRPNPHVHWHVAPRYSSPVVFGDETFVDDEFGEQLTWRSRHIDEAVRRGLIERLRQALPIEYLLPST